MNTNTKELSQYLRDSCFNPTLTTFANAISKGKFLRWTGLDWTTILQNTQEPITIKKNILAKKRKIYNLNKRTLSKMKNPFEDAFTNQEQKKTHKCGAVLNPFTQKELVYSDLTGYFPIRFSQGNQFMIVV